MHPEKPQLYMIWPTAQRPGPIEFTTHPAYQIRTYQPGDEQVFLELMALMDFDPFDDEKLRYNVARILPEGWFFAEERASGAVVGTAMCIHNYSGNTPFAGDVGWVACRQEHRGHGLGYALTAAVTNRFLAAGYSKIELGTEYYRLAAIKTYLRLGYLPLLYSPEVEEMWRAICAQISWPFAPGEWMRP